MQVQDLNLKIVTVHPSATIRGLLNAELRAKGYLDVLGVADLSDALTLLESQNISWIITPPMTEGRINIFQILKLATEDRTFIDLRCTLILDEPFEIDLLTKAYEMGLLSHHDSLKNRLEIEAEFKTLFDRAERAGGHLDLVAAEYLRPLLFRTERWTELLRLEKSLFQLHPGNLDLSIHYGTAQLKAGERTKAAELFSQIVTIHPEQKDRIVEVWRESEGETFASVAAEGGNAELPCVQSCFVIDPDPTELQNTKALLMQLGIPNLETFSSSDFALKKLAEGAKPDIVLFEWRMGPMAGPMFAQRMRETLGFGVPLTVISAELSENDMPLLREMGVTNRIKKPITPETFFHDFLWLVHQDRAPTEPFIILQKIRQAMADNESEKLAKLSRLYMRSDRCSSADKNLLQAELSYYRGHYTSSRDMALSTLKSGLVNVEVLNILGKSLMKMRDFETALKCFDTAQIVSPNNVRRICNIAESNLELGRFHAFEKNLKIAKDLDPDSPAVTEVELKGALVQGDGKKAQALMQSLKSLLTILSFTNNRAISLIRCERFEEGIGLYREALGAVPPAQIDIKGILQYNLSLALARLGRLDEAKYLLTEKEVAQAQKISSKAKSLLARVNKSLATGEPFALNMDQHPHALPALAAEGEGAGAPRPNAFEETLLALSIGPGDFCLYKIFADPRASPRWRELAERPLNFRRRQAS